MFTKNQQEEIFDGLDQGVNLHFFGDNDGNTYLLMLSEEMAEVKEEELMLNFKYQYCK